MKSWAAKDAKDHFSEVMDGARADGLQLIIRRGRAHGVVLSASDYEELKPKKLSLGGFLLSGPKSDHLEFERSTGTGREIDL